LSDTDGFDTPDYSNHPILKRPGFAAFRHRDYRFYWASRAFAIFAIDLMSATLLWQIWRITGSELAYAAMGAGMFLPFLILFPLSGMASDRFPRTRVMLGCATLQTMCAIGFVFLTRADTSFSYYIPIIVLLGIARAFQMPAQQAVVPVLVPANHLANAIAWQSTGFQGARVIGLGMSGVFIALGSNLGLDEQLGYGVAAAILAVSAIFTAMIKAKAQIISKDPLNLTNVSAGLKFVFSRPIILASIGLDLFAVLLGSAKALMPIFATDVLFISEEQYGLLQASLMVGSLTFMFYLTQYPIRRQAGIKLLIAVGVFGVATIIFGLSTSFWLSLAALFVVGAADSASVFVRNSLVQIITPDQMRGRVNAVSAVFIGASNEMGDAESGVIAHWFGAVPAVIIGGVGTVLVAVIFARIFPQLRGVDSLDPDDLVAKYRDVPPKSPASSP